MIKTAEFVSPKHPDKICDYIADSILDAYLSGDGKSRVAVEVQGGHKLVTINGEVTSKAKPNVRALVRKIVGDDYKIIVNISLQSPQIAQGVDTGGAGDQGIMNGYATSETPEYLPTEYVLARDLCQKIFAVYPYDGKTQVTVEDGQVTTVVVSFQNTKNRELLPLVKSLIRAREYLINPAGEWSQGGFDADSGLSGRKLVVDNYGPEIAIGGGSFSGKDYTKVDRSGAYMARRIAVDLLRKYQAEGKVTAVRTKLAYAIGKAEPVMAVAEIYSLDNRTDKAIGGAVDATVSKVAELKITGYDLSPAGIREHLKLDKVKFADTCTWGHFGRGFTWG